jgi:hypothetical protein
MAQRTRIPGVIRSRSAEELRKTFLEVSNRVHTQLSRFLYVRERLLWVFRLLRRHS